MFEHNFNFRLSHRRGFLISRSLLIIKKHIFFTNKIEYFGRFHIFCQNTRTRSLLSTKKKSIWIFVQMFLARCHFYCKRVKYFIFVLHCTERSEGLVERFHRLHNIRCHFYTIILIQLSLHIIVFRFYSEIWKTVKCRWNELLRVPENNRW